MVVDVTGQVEDSVTDVRTVTVDVTVLIRGVLGIVQLPGADGHLSCAVNLCVVGHVHRVGGSDLRQGLQRARAGQAPQVGTRFQVHALIAARVDNDVSSQRVGCAHHSVFPDVHCGVQI